MGGPESHGVHWERSSDLVCSFCGKKGQEIKKLIGGPRGVRICDECIDFCNEIIVEEIVEVGGPNWWPCSALNVRTPNESIPRQMRGIHSASEVAEEVVG